MRTVVNWRDVGDYVVGGAYWNLEQDRRVSLEFLRACSPQGKGVRLCAM